VSTKQDLGDSLPRVGTTLSGVWRLDALLGTGATAAVYAATNDRGQLFAIKLLHRELTGCADVRERFSAEARIASRLAGSGVVPVLDGGTDAEGTPFLVMPRLEGRTLEDLCTTAEPQPGLEQTLFVFAHVLSVLTCVHEENIVHRDVKPANVMLTTSGAVVLLDFGMARVGGSRRRHRTVVGSPMGTPAFMSPEQALAQWDFVDARSDIWAAGAMLYWMLSGRCVHEAETTLQQLRRAAQQPAPSLASVLLDPPTCLVTFVDRALAFDPGDRYPSAWVMCQALAQLVQQLSEVDRLRRFVSFLPPSAPQTRPAQPTPEVRPPDWLASAAAGGRVSL
jgi:serine/threonine protein kinase